MAETDIIVNGRVATGPVKVAKPYKTDSTFDMEKEVNRILRKKAQAKANKT